MRFLVDMGLSIEVSEYLTNQGHDTKHLRDEGLQRLPNGKIFEKALEEDRVILTHDLDFSEIVAITGDRKASVLLFRLHNTRTSHVIERLSKVLDEASSSLIKGAVIVVEELRYRIRYLPIVKEEG